MSTESSVSEVALAGAGAAVVGQQNVIAAAATAGRPGPSPLPLEDEIVALKALRRDIDAVIQRVKVFPAGTRERSLTITKLQEAVMWLGMDLKRIHDANPGETSSANPYPSSKDPSTGSKIEPTADGVKL